MEYIFAPFAKSQGVAKRKDITRFSEQAWLLLYYSVFWTLGIVSLLSSVESRGLHEANNFFQYIYCNSPHYLNLHELWTSWPVREVSGIMKGYMLAQLAFWVQQIIVINIEERRKDHWQMFAHHIVTNALIFASYRYGHTRVGNLILVLMDVVDLFFPVCTHDLVPFLFSALADHDRSSAGCKVSQIPRLQQAVRRDVRPVYGFMVCCASRLVCPCLLVGLRAL